MDILGSAGKLVHLSALAHNSAVFRREVGLLFLLAGLLHLVAGHAVNCGHACLPLRMPHRRLGQANERDLRPERHRQSDHVSAMRLQYDMFALEALRVVHLLENILLSGQSLDDLLFNFHGHVDRPIFRILEKVK